MSNNKLTYRMTSPGQAWMDHVNSKEGHNASAVTPAYLTPDEQNKRPNVDSKVAERKKELDSKQVQEKSIDKNNYHEKADW